MYVSEYKISCFKVVLFREQQVERYREVHVNRDMKETVPVRHQAFLFFLPQHERTSTCITLSS